MFNKAFQDIKGLEAERSENRSVDLGTFYEQVRAATPAGTQGWTTVDRSYSVQVED